MPKYLVILHDAQDDSPAGREELKLRMCDTLKVSSKAVLNIFQALPVIIRRDLEEQVAEKYAQTLERLGAVVEVIEQPDQLPEEQSLHVLGDVPPPAKSHEAPAFTAEQEQELGDLEALLDDVLQGSEPEIETIGASAAAAAPAASNDDFGLTLGFDDEPSVQRAPVILDMLEEETVAAPMPLAASPAPHPPARPPAPEEPQSAQPAAQPAHESPPQAPVAAQPDEPPVQMGAFVSPYSAARPADPAPSPWVPPPPVKKSGLSGKQMTLGAMCGFLILSVAFGRTALETMLGGGRQTMQVSFDIERLLKEQGSILGLAKTVDDAPAEITGHWVGQSDEGGISTRLRITELGRLMQLAALEVNTVQPPPLTDKELVEGKPLPVWLRKFEAVNVRLLPESAGPADTLRFAGNGRAYFQDGKGNDRQLVEVEIQVQSPKEGMTVLEASWILRRALEGADPEANQVSRLGKKDFRVFFRGKASVSFEKPALAKKIPKK